MLGKIGQGFERGKHMYSLEFPLWCRRQKLFILFSLYIITGDLGLCSDLVKIMYGQ